jgi:hypothetical protein
MSRVVKLGIYAVVAASHIDMCVLMMADMDKDITDPTKAQAYKPKQINRWLA